MKGLTIARITPLFSAEELKFVTGRLDARPTNRFPSAALMKWTWAEEYSPQAALGQPLGLQHLPYTMQNLKIC